MSNRPATRHAFLTVALTILTIAAIAPLSSVAQEADPYPLNRTAELLEEGETTFGIFSHDRSLTNARSLSRSDLDFILIDMEHGPYDPETLERFLLGMTDKARIASEETLQPKVTPIVRIPQPGEEDFAHAVQQVLDAGAYGVMFPFIETREEALRAVKAARFPHAASAEDAEPQGIRGVTSGPARMWGLSPSTYWQEADLWPLDSRGDLLTVLQIETDRGVENVDAIASVPGIGVLFVGPADLSASLGHIGNPGHPDVQAHVDRVLEACREHGIPCGITASEESVDDRIEEGFRFITVGSDGGITPGTGAALETGRSAAGRD